MKKWFVVSKEKNKDGDYRIVDRIRYRGARYVLVETIREVTYFGYPFDTEEEASYWATSKMHAVELEVE